MRNSDLAQSKVFEYKLDQSGQVIGGRGFQRGKGPGPLKCFCAPSHHILAKSAPQKARNRDKADFATKVRESSMNNWGTFDSKSLFKGGTFDSLSQVLKFSGGTFEDFTTTKSP